MTSILKQENGELFLYRRGERCPRNDDYSMYYGHQDPSEMLDQDWERWFSTAERIKVADKRSEVRISQVAWELLNLPDDKKYTWYDRLSEGIEIPDTCYEVRESYKPGWQKIRLAYFKSPVVQEKEVKDNLASEGAGEYEKTMRWAESELGLSSYSRESTETPSPQELKEHAIEFVKWIKKNEIDYSMTWEQIHDIFLSSK